MSQAGNSKLMTSSLVKCFCRLSFVVLDGHLVRVSMAAHSSLLQWFQQRWRHLQILQFQTCREIAMYDGNDSMHGKTLQLLLQALAAITICLATHNFGQYSGIFTSVQEKLNNFAQRIKRKIWKEMFFLRDLHCTVQSNDFSISSAIWQVILVIDSLGNTACAKCGHRHKFKHQMCCPGYQRRHNADEIMKSSFSCHRNRLLWTLRICHLVNGSLVIFQPSPVVPTKVVPLASPAISTGPPVRSNARCNPANNITICPTAQKFGVYFRSFTSFKKRLNNFAQSVKRFDKRYSLKYVLSNRLVLYCQSTWRSPQPSGKSS